MTKHKFYRCLNSYFSLYCLTYTLKVYINIDSLFNIRYKFPKSLTISGQFIPWT